MFTADLTRIEPTKKIAPTFVHCDRNLGMARRAANVRIECAAHTVRPAMLRAKVLTELSAYATRAVTDRISTTTVLGSMSASIPRDVAISTPVVPNHDAKHAAGRTTETHGATNALSTNARTKARRLQKRHNKTNCPETTGPICAICEACGSSEVPKRQKLRVPRAHVH